MTVTNPAIPRHARHVNPAFVRLLGMLGYGRVFTRARDVWLWDDQERQYLDFLAGFGSVNLGHNHPRLVARLQRFLAEEALHFCHVGLTEHAALLGEALCKRLDPPLEVVLLASSGGEAVEAGMKLARAATRRSAFVFCEGGFHGTSFGTLSVMGAERMRKPFEPLLAGCHRVPFGDLEALERVLRREKVAAFVVEPMLAEGGVVLPPPGYLKDAQALCRKHGALLVLDEVQTGLGRLGRRFAYQGQGFVPDVLVLAKALSGGAVPVSAAVTSSEIHERAYGSMDRFDLHSTTFGGNALACTAAMETLDILEEEGLAANAAARGAELLEGLRKRLAGHPLVRDIRGEGLLVGVELGPTESGLLNRLVPGLVEQVSEKVFGQWAALRLLEEGIVCQPASHRWDVLRLEPPLTVKPAQIEQVVDAMARILGNYTGLVPLLRDVVARVGEQRRREGAFR
ncbi:aspartate aminotransferase family protein [Hyalangium sp.]|uniref:aspartate aminotransferase family protein n=1 Tax=Hyalangium sp. TaxID=2028555 RepID=UPI0038997F80